MLALGDLVTAVIPTRNRPELVLRAVRSALAQTYEHVEVVVVIDGPDPVTERALAEVADDRLRVIALPASVGAAEARNAGVRSGHGAWIAFLDDDDEWLPEKLERQLAVARGAACKYPIVSCRQIARTPDAEYVWPRRAPHEGEPLSDYIFRRRGLFQGEGAVTTITLLVKRALLLEVPFGTGQRRHQEWDWLLRALQVDGTAFVFCPDVLAVWNAEERRPSISAAGDWRYSYDWIRSVRSLVTPEAYAAFLLTLVTARAAQEGDWKGCVTILRESLRNGRPSALDIALFGGMVVIPQRHRRWLRAIVSGRRS